MGATYVEVKVYGRGGQVELRALADTGATFTKDPPERSRENQPRYESLVQVSTRAVVPRQVGHAELEMEGVTRLVTLAIGEDGKPPLLGFTALEILEFKVNPTTRKLERAGPANTSDL